MEQQNVFVVTIMLIKDVVEAVYWAEDAAETLEQSVFDTREHAEEFVCNRIRAWIENEFGDIPDIDDNRFWNFQYHFDTKGIEFVEWVSKYASIDDLDYMIEKYLGRGEHGERLFQWRIDCLPVRKDGIIRKKA